MSVFCLSMPAAIRMNFQAGSCNASLLPVPLRSNPNSSFVMSRGANRRARRYARSFVD